MRLHASSKGQALVEMALTLPVLLVIIIGGMDLGRAAYIYNGLSSLARESSHYAMIEYSTDASSPCFWSSFDSAGCLTQVKNYAVGLNQVPELTSVNVSVDLVACQSTCSTSSYPITVAMGTHFQPISGQVLGIGPFDITASSTSQFVAPPPAGATPTPTPTTTGPEVAATGVTISPTSGCTSNCQEFAVTWTPPANHDALGHYDIAYGSAGSYEFSGPLPPSEDGNPVSSTVLDVPSQVHAECVQVTAVYSDGTQAAATAGWNDSSASPPNC